MTDATISVTPLLPRVFGALEVVCPACNARPGERCTQPTDTGRREVKWWHAVREYDAITATENAAAARMYTPAQVVAMLHVAETTAEEYRALGLDVEAGTQDRVADRLRELLDEGDISHD